MRAEVVDTIRAERWDNSASLWMLKIYWGKYDLALFLGAEIHFCVGVQPEDLLHRFSLQDTSCLKASRGKCSSSWESQGPRIFPNPYCVFTAQFKTPPWSSSIWRLVSHNITDNSFPLPCTLSQIFSFPFLQLSSKTLLFLCSRLHDPSPLSLGYGYYSPIKCYRVVEAMIGHPGGLLGGFQDLFK